MVQKITIVDLPDGEKKISRFGTIPTCDAQTICIVRAMRMLRAQKNQLQNWRRLAKGACPPGQSHNCPCFSIVNI